MSAPLRVDLGGLSRNGTAIRATRDDLLAVRLLAEKRPDARPFTAQILATVLQARGLSLSDGEAEELARLVLAAEAYHVGRGILMTRGYQPDIRD